MVKDGELSITSAFLPDAADVYLTTGSTFNLDFTAGSPDVIDSLFIDNISQAIGTWGAMGSGAAHETSLITGMGMLLVSTVGSIPGDYNMDGYVDSADYVIWRKDPVSHGGTPGGYDTWRANFGTTPGAGAGSNIGTGAAVPEPTAFALLACAAMGIFGSRRSRATRDFR